jgi:hypothetical protein
MMVEQEDTMLSKALAFYRKLLKEYSHHVEWMRRAGISNGDNHDQQLVIGMLAISNYNSGKSILALYEAGQGDQTLIFVRSQFEQAAKAEYFAKHKARARDFLDLEPFERYKLTQGYKIRDALRGVIVSECKKAVKNNPRLLRHQSEKSKGAARADFLAIRQALKPPSMEQLLKTLKWDPALYVTIFLFGSLRIHGSINDLRDFFEQNADGSVTFASEQDLQGPPDYLLQSSAYLVGFIGKIAEWFPGAGRQAQALSLRDELSALAKELGIK